MREGLFILLLFIFCPLFGSLKYYFTLVNGGGCPYTASWLVSVDLFHLLSYEVTWHKMESVTWDVLKTSKWNFQFFNESSYFVHHMSQFEHFHRKKSGYTVSENLTSIYSNEALKGICMGVQRQTEDFQSSYHESSIALVPFYGGRPPNVTADFKVNSLGQGNSLVKAEIKVIQTVATICSILNHFGRVIVGVVRNEDKTLILEMLNTLPSFYHDRIFVKLISNLSRPANLPFGLIMWAKRYILQYQCHYHYTHNTTHHLIHYKRYIEPTCPEIFHGYSNPLNSSHILLSTLLGTTFNAKEIQNIDKKLQNETILQNFTKFYLPSHLITHVYYTESDQMLFFESSTLRNIILKSLNISIHVIGRRREKVGHSNPYQPFNDLYPTRHLCGNVSDPYVLDTDVDCFIRRESHKR